MLVCPLPALVSVVRFRARVLPHLCMSSAVPCISGSLLKRTEFGFQSLRLRPKLEGMGLPCPWLGNAGEASVRRCGEAVEGSESCFHPHSSLWGLRISVGSARCKPLGSSCVSPDILKRPLVPGGAQPGWVWKEPWQYWDGRASLSFPSVYSFLEVTQSIFSPESVMLGTPDSSGVLPIFQ